MLCACCFEGVLKGHCGGCVGRVSPENGAGAAVDFAVPGRECRVDWIACEEKKPEATSSL